MSFKDPELCEPSKNSKKVSRNIFGYSKSLTLVCDKKWLQFTFIYTLYANKENEPPNQEVARKLLKEVQEVEHIKNDTLCIEERIFGMFPLGIDCFNWSGALSQLFLTYRLQEMDISLNFCFIAIDFF